MRFGASVLRLLGRLLLMDLSWTVLFENTFGHGFRLHLAAGEAWREVVPGALRWVLAHGAPGWRWWPYDNNRLGVESHFNLSDFLIDYLHVVQDRFHHILQLKEYAELRFVYKGVIFVNHVLSFLLFLSAVR